EAAPVELRWGHELSEINLGFGRQQSLSVSGVVADVESGGPCHMCTVHAQSLEAFPGFSERQFVVASDGAYRLRGLVSGDYRISATKAVGRRHMVASRVVHLNDRNLRDVHLVVGSGHAVTGRVVFESPPRDVQKGEMHVVFIFAGGGR